MMRSTWWTTTMRRSTTTPRLRHPSYSSGKMFSKARWIGEMGMAEVVETKGKMWTTTGIIRNGKTYCYLKETLFLAEIGALLVLDDNDMSFSLKDLYEKVGNEKIGCC